jgi:sugar/nucleoside kinase (ribokinase family)
MIDPMTPDTPTLDLLVIGGLTVDRFADGSSEPGGSVLHIARAAASRGMRIGIVTAAGPEAEAGVGLDELRRHAARVETSRDATTVTFRHLEAPSGRRLWLEQRGGTVAFDADATGRIETRAILYAPVADEVPADALGVSRPGGERGAILQGWLRTADASDEVQPRLLSALSDSQVEALRGLDLLVASREDLLAEADDPSRQLQALRRAFGPGPSLFVTDGVDGAWVDAAASSGLAPARHLAVPWRVDDAPTVGSGDIFAAFMLMSGRDPSMSLERRTLDAMRVVAEVLEQRKEREMAGGG